MASLLPTHEPVESSPADRTEVVVDGTGSGAALSVLNSETARAVLGVLREEPKPVSMIAEAADTSIQNARYHVDRLRDVGFVEPVDVWYSAKGKEMTVYASTLDRLVVRFEPVE
jgi:DNA-binding transcriptional ArsR family regulator